jgi:hypothetical protein
MKTTLITFCIINLFNMIVASSFTNGMTTGFVVSNVERIIESKNKEESVIKYNNFTRDTSLQKFPPVSSPQCISEKKRIHQSMIFTEIVTTCVLLIIGFMSWPIIFFSPEEDCNWFIGYINGQIIEDIFADDNI